MVTTIDTAGSADFKELRKTLFKDLRTADKDLKGLSGAIDMIRKNRQKFPDVKDSELTSRTMFVEESQVLGSFGLFPVMLCSQLSSYKLSDCLAIVKRLQCEFNSNSLRVAKRL
jgi:hypothetical protein